MKTQKGRRGLNEGSGYGTRYPCKKNQKNILARHNTNVIRVRPSTMTTMTVDVVKRLRLGAVMRDVFRHNSGGKHRAGMCVCVCMCVRFTMSVDYRIRIRKIV